MTAIRFRDASVSYGGPAVVSEVNLDVEPRELHVLLGESGSGKTTLLRAVAGFEPLAGGELAIEGEVVDRGDGRPMAPEKRRVGVVFQDYALFPHLDVAGNLAFGQKRRDQARIDELLQAVGLGDYGKRSVGSLSGGEQQRVALARAMAQAPRIILFDEPFSNLNRTMRRSLRQQTTALLRELEITAIFVTHDREEAFAIADRLSVLADGALLASGAPLDLYADPIHAGVAHALGDCTLLDGERSGGGVRCCLGTVAARGEGSRLVVRPADIKLGESGGVAATVTHVELAGPDSTLSLQVGDTTIAAKAANKRFEPGDETTISIEPASLATVS